MSAFEWTAATAVQAWGNQAYTAVPPWLEAVNCQVASVTRQVDVKPS